MVIEQKIINALEAEISMLIERKHINADRLIKLKLRDTKAKKELANIFQREIYSCDDRLFEINWLLELIWEIIHNKDY